MNRLPQSKLITYATFKAFLALCICNLLSSSIAAAVDISAEKTTISSKLVPDERGILRLQAGNDGKTALDLASALSMEPTIGYLVIVVMTNDTYQEQAIAHGLKLQAWFEKQISTKSEVPLVVHKNDKGVGYVYKMLGHDYTKGGDIPHGVLTVQQSVKLLEDARIEHRAMINIKNDPKRRHLLVNQNSAQ